MRTDTDVPAARAGCAAGGAKGHLVVNKRAFRSGAAMLLSALLLPSFVAARGCSNGQVRVLSGVAPRPAPSPVTYVDLGQPGCAAGGAVDTSYLVPDATRAKVRVISYPQTPTSPPVGASYRFDNRGAQPLTLDWNLAMQTWDATLEISDAQSSLTIAATVRDLDGNLRTYTVTYARPERL
jgi:hypothetical protein